MVRQIFLRINLSQNQIDHLNGLIPHTKEMWDKPPDITIKQIKSEIRSQLLNMQDFICAYCGLDLGGTSEGQIEHIAPKGRYPQFTFEIENLAMACHYCNGFSKKGTKDTIQTLSVNYEDCEYKLVHPYYDNPDEHYEWTSANKRVLIQHKTNKGEYSINLFNLDDPQMSLLRGKKIVYQIVESQSETPQIDDELIQQILDYRPH